MRAPFGALGAPWLFYLHTPLVVLFDLSLKRHPQIAQKIIQKLAQNAQKHTDFYHQINH